MSHYIPNTEEDSRLMLESLGLTDIEDLFSDIPPELRLKQSLELPQALSELELQKHMKRLASKNADAEQLVCFLGAGSYDHFIPAAVRHMVSRSEFYTAYTPYQPEISQGMLQAIFEYQTMICQLTGMDASNASMYDGATALAEAAIMAARSTGRNTVAVSRGVHPEYREVLKTYARFHGIRVIEVGLSDGVTDWNLLNGSQDRKEGQFRDGSNSCEASVKSGDGGMRPAKDTIGRIAGEKSKYNYSDDVDLAGVIVQSPNFLGVIEDLKGTASFAAGRGALSIACTDPISLALLEPPGKCGIDIAVGDGQPLGNPMSFGGPYLGFLAVKKELVRKMPGRIVGETTDMEGRRGFVLTLQAREQHIRREKAVSNICSNQALNALASAVYLSVMGRKGLKEVADLCIQKSHYAQEQLLKTGCFEKGNNAPFFKEFAVRSVKCPIEKLNARLLENGISGGLDLGRYAPEWKDCWLIAVTEKRTREEIDLLVKLASKGGN